MIRVLALSKYDRLAASPRHRFLQYQAGLGARGISLELSPLFDDSYLRDRFASGDANLEHVARAVLRRTWALVRARSYDLCWVHCELVPFLHPALERLSLAGLRYVFDYDDAIFHSYDLHRSWLVRQLLGSKISRVIAGARAVTAGSRYLMDYAAKFNRKVHLVPTVIDLDRYRAKVIEPSGRPFTVGWIGSPSTSPYLDLVRRPLERLAQLGPTKLLAVGARPLSIPGVEVEVRPWSEAREVPDLLECDVGIMPLTDTPWSKGKCAFKLIQYMGCALPVVASPVGANQEVVTPESGVFAPDEESWYSALLNLRSNPALRERMGRAGRERVAANFSVVSQLDPVAAVLSEAAGRGQTNRA